MHGRIAIVDDDAEMRAVLAEGLERRGFQTRTASGAETVLEWLEEEDFDAVLTDLNMPSGISGVELCRRLTTNRPDIPVLVITAFGSLESAIAAIRAGAYDFITKPYDTDQLGIALSRAVQHRRLREEVRRLRLAVSGVRAGGDLGLAGESSSVTRLRDIIARAGPTDASVLVTGESGTGKELVARAVHGSSSRASGPFVAVDCAAIPEALLESELFGHTRGAFTGAREVRKGLFLQADRGTLFLDEIGDISKSLQPKLLRAIQQRRVRPVGSDEESAFDVRIVAATNKDLEAEVHAGRFREDLYFRLNVIGIEAPPLRVRGNDALILAQRFIEEHSQRAGKRIRGFTPEAAERLLTYPWPGNVRELQNCIERAVVLTRFEEIAVEDLPERIREHRSSDVVLASEDPRELISMIELEKRYIARVLQTVRGNRTTAARILGFDRKTLYRKLKQYRIGSEHPSAGLATD